MNEQTYPDLRTELARAQDWVQGVMAGVTHDQLDRPTPCPEFDVRALIGHLYTGADRVAVMAAGGDALSIPFISELPEDDLAGGYGERALASQRAWQDNDLTGVVRAPFGEVPAAEAIGNYLCEALAHGWDLAVATGQPAEADQDLAEIALQVSRRRIPAEVRGGRVPFGPVVESAPTATPTERFVNWTGRDTSAWAAA
ncbi:TIGR03086 family protein [Microlunatus elymi]|uniref:TIGR03086 family protein n=1 Tax=Microlunatus elymi TaxID=2596828 RepID=A0A516Q3V2_9ACTN|nr:TIGR03086 family metal-binding protein [Microlunatus elymi]QDP98123.1 TIGR03086 family protein [Microlunatus elymi]